MTCILPSAYLAPIDHYAILHQSNRCLTEVCDHYAKQTYRNRCLIAAPDGPQALTIPIEKPATPKAPMRDIRISDHGNWRHMHWIALQTAYSRTPFFEYYADDFAPFYQKKWDFLVDFNHDLQQLVCSLIDLHTEERQTENYIFTPEDGVQDYRNLVEVHREPVFVPRPYYQVFREKHGFIPNLSIVDLLFNMGPESILYL